MPTISPVSTISPNEAMSGKNRQVIRQVEWRPKSRQQRLRWRPVAGWHHERCRRPSAQTIIGRHAVRGLFLRPRRSPHASVSCRVAEPHRRNSYRRRCQTAKQGKSLLPAGVVRVGGSFERGDAVIVRCKAGQELARGLSAYSNVDAPGLPVARAEDRNDSRLSWPDELIHRDDWVLTTWRTPPS